MQYTVIPAVEMTQDLVARWDEIQQADFTLANPYFRPEFTLSVSAVRNDVFVGLLKNSLGVVGFFPFHRKPGKVAKPIGLGLSDYHGVISASGAEWNIDELMHGCDLVRWEFDHLPASQTHFSKYHTGVSDSPIIDISQGMEFFESSRNKAGRKQLKEIQRKREKLSKEVGPITFTLHSQSHEILRQMISWKSRQCRNTGVVDFFAMDWCKKLIEQIHATQEQNFGGILSCLHAGDKLAAVHFAMYSQYVWHSWFPAYNHDLEEYSPGQVLLFEMIGAAAENKIKYIDLGKGMHVYKKKVMTGSIPVAEGCIALPSFYNRLKHMREMMEMRVRQSYLWPLFRIPGKMIKKIEQQNRFR